MEKIEPGKYVEIGYDLYEVTPEGETLRHQVIEEDPERLVYGVTPGFVKPLEDALLGLKPGDTFDLTVKADDAFGPYDPELVPTLSKDLFMVDGKFDAEYIVPGNSVPMRFEDGAIVNGLVVKVTDDSVTLDFNHPLAGKDVRFVGDVYTVRDATPEDLHPACGCSGCGCGGCGEGDCGCGDSCSCAEGECGCGDSCSCGEGDCKE